VSAPTRTVYVVPHTHWDREWYATFETFRAQLVELWDQLLDLTEVDPEFRFLMDGQTVVIDDYLEVRPQAGERLERAIRGGQIQVGPWYTLPDEFLVSAETLVRNLQRGLATAESHGGSMRVGYLPDSFGHAAQMPQIYRQLGFTHAAVWRGVPLVIDRVAFVWEAPDGSEILTAYMGNSYSHGVDLPMEAEPLAARIRAALKAIEPFHPGTDVLLMNGNDHVLPQAGLTAAVRQASERLDGTRIRLARLDDYLAVLPAASWPRWQGELRASARANVLMGTLSVRAPDKQLYAHAARALERIAEPTTALSGLDMSGPLHKAWTLILQNAAHDTACGSGIDAVAEAARRRSQAALDIASEIADRCLRVLAGDGQVWNPSAFPRQGVIEVDGRPQLIDHVSGGSVGPIKPLAPRVPVRAHASGLENAYLRVEMQDDGTFSLLDKINGLGYKGLHRLVDEADIGDEYNFSPLGCHTQPANPIRQFAARMLEDHPARARLEATFNYAVFSGLSRDRRGRGPEMELPARLMLSLDADVPRLDIEFAIENQATDHRLRAHFPLPFAVAVSAADTPFHVTRRSVIGARRDPGAPEMELPTYPMRSFVDLSNGRAGMTLITDGLHEYEVIPGATQEVALTLLRAVGWLSRDDLTTRTGHAGPGMETPGAQVLGAHRFRFSLYFHRGDWAEGNVWRAAEATLLPLVVAKGAGAAGGRTTQLIELEPDCIQMTALIPRQDGYEIRLLNASDQASEAGLRLEPVGTLERSNLGGNDLERIAPRDGRFGLGLRPWEIVTLRLTR
jgi:alpha-mannosidase